MPRDPRGERWPEVYRDTPEVFDRFSRAEDAQGVLPNAFVELAGLKGKRVLEVGCGTGRWTREFAAHAASYVALEPAKGMLALAVAAGAPAVQWVHGQGQALPVRDNAVERVIAGWVFANLRPKAREAAIAEARRVVGNEGELWALENHWEDDFQALRREAGLEVTVEVAPLLEGHGFELISTLETRMSFDSTSEAEEILGTILGPRVRERLAAHPVSGLRHRVCLLRARR